MNTNSIFLIRDKQSRETLISANSLTEAKRYKRLIKKIFGKEGIEIRQIKLNNPIIKREKNNASFAIKGEDNEIFSVFASFDEARFFLDRLKEVLGEPVSKVKIEEIAPINKIKKREKVIGLGPNI